jgi:neutral ceramidase
MGPTTADVTLSIRSQVVETPRKAGMGWAPDLGAYLRVTSTGEAVVRLPIRFLQINKDVAIWSAPLELFCEIAMKIRSLSPFPFTFYFGYCNGWLGYMPTQAKFAYGGYEPGVSPYTGQAEHDVTRALVAYLQGRVH